MSRRVRLTVPSGEQSLPVVRAVVATVAQSLGASDQEMERFSEAVGQAVTFISSEVYPGGAEGELELSLDPDGQSVRVEIRDRGRPLPTAGGELGDLPPALSGVAREAADARIINLGRDGKLTTFSWPLPSLTGAPPDAAEPGSRSGMAAGHGTAGAGAEVEIREATPADAQGISRLLYAHYALGYVHPDFYRPRWVVEQLRLGSVLSTIAVADDEIVGHHALLTGTGRHSAESGVAVVHPAYRGLGIFGRLMQATTARARRSDLAAIYGNAVTLHPFSQRAEHAHGYRETALQLAALPPLDPDIREPKRTAVLSSYLMLRPSPRAPRLPQVYERQLRATYAHLSLPLQPLQPLESVASSADISSQIDEELGTGLLRISGWDADAASGVQRVIRELLSHHVEVLFADLDLSTADVESAVRVLGHHGFFYAGLRPAAERGHDALRLQRLNTTRAELDRIVCDSTFAQELLGWVREDRARVAQLTV